MHVIECHVHAMWHTCVLIVDMKLTRGALPNKLEHARVWALHWIFNLAPINIVLSHLSHAKTRLSF